MNMMPYRKRDNNIFSFMDDFERSFFNNSVSGISQFRTDISEKADEYMLEAELPGFEEKDISVEVDGDTLTISATKDESSDEKDKDGNYIRRERRYGSFSRSFDITGVDIEGITANYQNGVLKLEMPKKKEAQPETRRIEVKQAQGTARPEKQQEQPQPQNGQENNGPVQ